MSFLKKNLFSKNASSSTVRVTSFCAMRLFNRIIFSFDPMFLNFTCVFLITESSKISLNCPLIKHFRQCACVGIVLVEIILIAVVIISLLFTVCLGLIISKLDFLDVKNHPGCINFKIYNLLVFYRLDVIGGFHDCFYKFWERYDFVICVAFFFFWISEQRSR